MMGENGFPVTPEWHPEPRCCPFVDCGVCETPQQSVWLHEPHIERGDN